MTIALLDMNVLARDVALEGLRLGL
ncbi:MAG: hypothetical protein LZF62_100024 [Nitrospira sp.]|nr:MAG: hypothetical protein LZF62_100024 [Nitrospira sp.]